MKDRSPVVTILGHVDHGKTSLLDFIRRSRLTAKEHGGITQRIGAYSVDTGLKSYPTSQITFIDTPGHEAFTKLRSRGAATADIAILIVDAKDSVMPQTIESIAHIKSAKIPFIVALNKTDLPEANPQKVERDLLKYGVQTESQGGSVPAIKISATTGKGVDDLLEAILILSSEQKLKYDEEAQSQCVIIETSKDKRGVVVSVIVQNGILRVGDSLYSNDHECTKIRALIDDTNKPVKTASPSMPVQILGFSSLPEVGSMLTARSAQNKKDEPVKAVSIEVAKSQTDMIKEMFAPKSLEKKLSVIIKTDSQGSLEALLGSLEDNKKIDVILASVGDIHKSDVFLAKATGAIIVGFSVSTEQETAQLAQQEKIVIKTYPIIYQILEELEEVTNLIAAKEAASLNLKAEGKVLAIFDISGEKVCGLVVTKGKFTLGDEIQVFRDGDSFAKAKIISLKSKAKKIREAKKGEECGALFSPQLDIRAGDIVKYIL
jgi:translation initiation factor IF-2